ncbi:MAG: hypothetical protein M3N52_05100 [Actinomycetota bacterium]|nr:hypothetical protein [Actinomycetota bacterium]
MSVLPLGSDLAFEPLETAVPAIQTVAEQATEVVFGTLQTGGREFDVQLLDRSELAEALAAVAPNEWVLYGTFPATDGEPPSIRFTPPDADGVVRPQSV